jgi:molecular chaperone GrpE
MNSNQEIESLDGAAEETETDESISVDDFIRQLEAKEKDLHITAETSVIEIAAGFDNGELPDFMKDEFPDESVVSLKPAAPHKEKAAQTKLEAENKKLKERLAKLEDEYTEMTKASQRRTKDFANFKTRTERERRETFQNQLVNLATKMLPALDNLNRAVDFAHELPRDETSEFQPFIDGVVLVNQQVNDVLASMGIVTIETVGEDFDPHFHEAAATVETDEFPRNTICGEMLRGYRIDDRVIRHSIVRVAKPLPDPERAAVIEKMLKNEEAASEAEATAAQTVDDPAGDSAA